MLSPSCVRRRRLSSACDLRRVARVRERHEVALARLQLVEPHRRIRRDREDEGVDRLSSAPIVGEGAVADRNVLLEADEGEWPGSDRFLIEPFRRSGPEHRVRIFGRKDGVERHRKIGEERRVRARQPDAHRVVVELVDRAQELAHAEVLEVVVPRRPRRGDTGWSFFHCRSSENSTSSAFIVARRHETSSLDWKRTPRRRWKVYSRPSSEISQDSARPGAIVGRARREFDELVEHRAAGIHARRRRDDLRVEGLRIALGAEHQGLCSRRPGAATTKRRRAAKARRRAVMDLLLPSGG